METLHFNETSMGWTKNDATNRHWLQLQIDYLQELLKYRGYLYLNQIYETLGIEWDPEKVNICYRLESGVKIDMQPGQGFEYVVEIYQ